MLLSQSDLLGVKFEILKDLQKQLKSGYKSQYKNIMSSIAMTTKVFMKKKYTDDYSTQIDKFNYVNTSLTQHLIDVFDVFGDSAVLNAKVIFEENAKKWARKILRRFRISSDNIRNLIKDIYIDMGKYDYIEIDDQRLIWYFYKTRPSEDLFRYNRHWSIFYDIKKIWLNTLISTLNCELNFLEPTENDNEKIVTIIEIKKA